MKMILGRNCEVEKLIKFLKETKMFKEIYRPTGRGLTGAVLQQHIITTDFDAG